MIVTDSEVIGAERSQGKPEQHIELMVRENEVMLRRIAADLRESIAVELNLARHLINSMTRHSFRAPGLQEEVSALRGVIETTLSDVLRLAGDLRPETLEYLGLSAALKIHVQVFGRKTGIASSFESSTEFPVISPVRELFIFRIAQEALSNVHKHSEAGHVDVELAYRSGIVSLTISDDGLGFDVGDLANPGPTFGYMGIAGMCERARLLRGKMDIESGMGNGTRVRLVTPLDGARK